jgi:hypothetical protein
MPRPWPPDLSIHTDGDFAMEMEMEAAKFPRRVA